MKQKSADSIFVTRVEQGSIRAILLGKTPLIENRLSEKTKHELLYPKGRKSSAEKATSMKHDPIAEFLASPHTFSDKNSPTLLAIPASAPKKAIAAAALDMPGAKKAQIGRLSWIPGEYVPVYGTPQIFLKPVRSADMNRTPDIRTRCIVRQWAIPIEIQFASPILNPTIIINLLVAAGMFVGLGDWRNEKGSSNYGQFDVLSEEQAADNDLYQELLKQGRSVQTAAMSEADPYDAETAELLEWFGLERKLRGRSAAA